MSFIVGKDTIEVHKLLGGSDLKYRAVFVGTEQVWPYYVVGTDGKKLTFSGSANVLQDYGKDYTLPFGSGNPQDSSGNYLDAYGVRADPAGGTFSFPIDCHENSNWHHLTFTIKSDNDWVSLSTVKEQGQSTTLANMSWNASSKTYTATLDKECVNQDKPLVVSGSVGENKGTTYRYCTMTLNTYQGALDETLTVNKKIFTMQQGPNVIYYTKIYWEKQESTVTYNVTSTGNDDSLFLRVSFGISIDGGHTKYYAPANDHLNDSGQISATHGNLLTTATAANLSVSSTNSSLTPKIEYDSIGQGYTRYKISFTMNANTEANNSSKIIDYNWENPAYDSKYEWSSEYNWNVGEISRTIPNILRGSSINPRVADVAVTCTYPHHEFTI